MTDEREPGAGPDQANTGAPTTEGHSDKGGQKRSAHRHRISARRLKKLRQSGRAEPAVPTDEIAAARRLDGDWHPPSFLAPRYGALDLGTNNCRLLVAAPARDGFRVVDAFSRIVRLGEGLSVSGRLSEAAMDRTVEALKICREKIEDRRVTSLRCIATQACRGASNGEAFLARIREETGLSFDLITTEEEATLSVRGCLDLTDPRADVIVVFDIGGGSTEISWVRRTVGAEKGRPARHKIEAWTSIPFGVVTLSEKFGGRDISRETYDAMVEEIAGRLRRFGDAETYRPLFEQGHGHLLGTSGTVTSIAGVHLGLKRYNRKDIDGIWLASERALTISEKLRAMGFEGRAREACIGEERADLVVAGCAILEGILAVWPSDRIRVADRGLREGILAELIATDRRKRRRRRRR